MTTLRLKDDVNGYVMPSITSVAEAIHAHWKSQHAAACDADGDTNLMVALWATKDGRTDIAFDMAKVPVDAMYRTQKFDLADNPNCRAADNDAYEMAEALTLELRIDVMKHG